MPCSSSDIKETTAASCSFGASGLEGRSGSTRVASRVSVKGGGGPIMMVQVSSADDEF
jgi:hypothetical protein